MSNRLNLQMRFVE